MSIRPTPDCVQFRDLVARTCTAAFTLDADGKVATWSQDAEKLLGYSAEDVVGGPAISLVFMARPGGRGELDALLVCRQLDAPPKSCRAVSDVTNSAAFGHCSTKSAILMNRSKRGPASSSWTESSSSRTISSAKRSGFGSVETMRWTFRASRSSRAPERSSPPSNRNDSPHSASNPRPAHCSPSQEEHGCPVRARCRRRSRGALRPLSTSHVKAGP